MPHRLGRNQPLAFVFGKSCCFIGTIFNICGGSFVLYAPRFHLFLRHNFARGLCRRRDSPYINGSDGNIVVNCRRVKGRTEFCCGARNLHAALTAASNFDRCHSFLPASPATGGARKRPVRPYGVKSAASRTARRGRRALRCAVFCIDYPLEYVGFTHYLR